MSEATILWHDLCSDGNQQTLEEGKKKNKRGKKNAFLLGWGPGSVEIEGDKKRC